jgi:putative ABC transport system substrate-binding protein
MQRREFITFLGCAVASWPIVADAQSTKSPARIGFLPIGSQSNAYDRSLVEAFRRGLADVGIMENRDVVLDIVWVTGDPNAAVSELLQRGVDLLVPCGSSASVAAGRQTSTIPILFIAVGNPIGVGLVESLPHPGRNVTGFNDILADLSGKYVEIARELDRSQASVDYLWHMRWPDGQNRFEATVRAADALGVNLRARGIGDVTELDDAIIAIKQSGVVAVIVQPGPLTFQQRAHIIDFATKQGLGTVYAYPRSGARRCTDCVRAGLRGHFSPGCQLCRPDHPQGREACQSAGAAACQNRSDRKSQDRQGARPHDPANTARARHGGDRMRRREFISVLGGVAVAWPLGAWAQQAERTRRIGVLMSNSEDGPLAQVRVSAFRQGLAERGWIEDRNLKIEWRWTGGDIARVREYAAELVHLAPDVIVANGTPSVVALKQATNSIPIVFVVVNDPVAQGIIPSMAHPGGNITGFSFLEYSMVGKSLQMLKQIAPAIVRVAVMFNPDTYPYYDIHLQSFVTVARTISLELTGAPARSPVEIDVAIARLGQQTGSALLIPPDPFMIVHRGAIIRAAAQYRVLAIYSYRQHVQEGGLMSYGADTIDIFKRSTSYVDRILKGTSPADLPAQAPAKFEIAINLRTAKAIGVDIPPNLLALADEVIE